MFTGAATHSLSPFDCIKRVSALFFVLFCYSYNITFSLRQFFSGHAQLLFVSEINTGTDAVGVLQLYGILSPLNVDTRQNMWQCGKNLNMVTFWYFLRYTVVKTTNVSLLHTFQGKSLHFKLQEKEKIAFKDSSPILLKYTKYNDYQ